MSGLGIITRRRAIQASPVQGDYIRFADPVAKKLCIDNFSSDGIGLTPEDAAAVTSIGLVFAGNKELVSFDEFKYFTSVTSISSGADAVTGGAFANCTALKSISLPNSLREIRPFSFYACEALESINLNNEYITLIGNEAFKSCKKMQVDINLPNLQVLGSRVSADVFMYSGITTITSLGIISKIWGYTLSEHGTFLGCTNLTSAILPETLTTIGGRAFQGCTQLAELNIPSSVTTIEGQALYNCTSLTYDILTLNVTTLGQNALYGVNIKSLRFNYLTSLPTSSDTTQNFGNKDILEDVILNGTLTSIPVYSFYNYKNLRNVSLSDTISTINNQAFQNTTSLESINLNYVKVISGYDSRGAFAGSGIKTLNAPNLESLPLNFSGTAYSAVFNNSALERIENSGKITTIPNGNSNSGCFQRCYNLRFARLPETLTSIGAHTFRYDTALETVICEATTPPTLGTNAFANTNSTFLIYVPDESVEAYKTATNWSAFASRIYPMSIYEI